MSDAAHPLDGQLEPGAKNYDALTSVAISLKRLADCFEAPDPKTSANISALLWEISQCVQRGTL